MNNFVLDKENTALLIIDVQDKLAAAMSKKQKVIDNTLHLIELAKLLEIPIIVTEQYPKGLGPTVSEITKAIELYSPLEKVMFNCCEASGFCERVKQTGRRQIVLTGMETHICVLQTAIGLVQAGYIVHTVADAVCSRTKDNWKIGLEFMRDAGVVITGTETALFQLLGVAGTEEFKVISKRIK